MPHLRSLRHDAVLPHLFKAYPETARPLLDYHQALPRGPSPLSVAQRELIAACVSGLNACAYCHGVYAATAGAFRATSDLRGALLADATPIEPPMRAVLRQLRKLTRLPAERPARADAEAVYTAGWDERAPHDAISARAPFDVMNRLVEGAGLAATPDYAAAPAGRLSAPAGYAGLRRMLD